MYLTHLIEEELEKAEAHLDEARRRNQAHDAKGFREAITSLALRAEGAAVLMQKKEAEAMEGAAA